MEAAGFPSLTHKLDDVRKRRFAHGTLNETLGHRYPLSGRRISWRKILPENEVKEGFHDPRNAVPATFQFPETLPRGSRLGDAGGMSQSPFSSIEDAIEAIRCGRMV